jgi:hypothetical protein
MFPPIIVAPTLFPVSGFWSVSVAPAFGPPAHFPGLIGKGDLQARLVVLVEPVVLKRVHRNRRLQRILEIDETEVELTTRLGHFFY